MLFMKYIIPAFIFFASFSACHSKDASAEDEAVPEAVTPVTVVPVSSGPMEETVELNATSSFQQKWIVKSNLNGYVEVANADLNKFVGKGQPLFTLVTKEARSIGNTINRLDPSFHFSGRNTIRANGSGYVSEVNHQPGDYVQDGEQLAVVTDSKSFAFILDLPYEMRGYISGKKTVPLLLPDGERLTATISGNLPIMDSAAQTQRVLLKVVSSHIIPENLIGKVQLIKRANNAAYFVPAGAVLANETQSEFWVMKMMNDSTAVKVPVKKGIETAGNIEIINPVFPANTLVLLTGNFALADTAKVKVMKTPSKE
jgi:hypothetical protein